MLNFLSPVSIPETIITKEGKGKLVFVAYGTFPIYQFKNGKRIVERCEIEQCNK